MDGRSTDWKAGWSASVVAALRRNCARSMSAKMIVSSCRMSDERICARSSDMAGSRAPVGLPREGARGRASEQPLKRAKQPELLLGRS